MAKSKSETKRIEALRRGPGDARVHDEGEKTYDEKPPKPRGFDPKRGE